MIPNFFFHLFWNFYSIFPFIKISFSQFFFSICFHKNIAIFSDPWWWYSFFRFPKKSVKWFAKVCRVSSQRKINWVVQSLLKTSIWFLLWYRGSVGSWLKSLVSVFSCHGICWAVFVMSLEPKLKDFILRKLVLSRDCLTGAKS